MAFTTPATATAGTALTAAWLNTYVRDNMAWIATDSPACRVYNNAAESIANNSITLVTYNSERYDNAAMHSTSSNTGRITIPTGGGGKYIVGVQHAWDTDTTASRRAATIRQNGTTLVASQQVEASTLGTVNHGLTVMSVYAMSAADYFDSTAFHDSGAALNLAVFAEYAPDFYSLWFRS